MTETATSQGVELKLADGSVVKADNADEALKMLAKMKEDTSSALKTEKDARIAAETRLSEYAAADIARTAARPASDGKFDNDHYFKLLNTDPINAQNYLDAHRFGIADPSQVPSYFTNMQETVSAVEGQLTAGGFLQRHPEFPQEDEPARLLRVEVEGLVKRGHPFAQETMDMAYSNLVDAGKVKPMEQKQQEREEANPSLGGAGSSGQISDAEIAKAENMSDKELEAYVRAKGMLG